MTTAKNALTFLEDEIKKREKRQAVSFKDYLEIVKKEPHKALRSIFQLFYDMVKSHVGEGVDEHPDDPESIGFVQYDCSRLFSEGSYNPFFADRLFANRFMRQVESLRQGSLQNRVYAFIGPSGCGKSTFLNNLLESFEAYTNAKEGVVFELIWEIDEKLFLSDEADAQTLTMPCPSHDCPLLIIPKGHRRKFLAKLLPQEFGRDSKIFLEKQYEWLLRNDACTICRAIFWASLEKLGSLDKVLSMVKARPYKFDRRLGEGVSIFNPGDKSIWVGAGGKPTGGHFTSKPIQEKLNRILGLNSVKYFYSPLANTNNGIYVLMDVKLDNEDRLTQLHNVISEGVHKVGEIEEYISSLFFALMNPEDQKMIEEKKMESLQGRIQYNSIPYVLEPATEAKIYMTNYGESVRKHFLPRIIENFARVIIASRMKEECEALKEWIPDMQPYERYCDTNGLLLRMEIYGGAIPDWLSEEDRKRFIAPVRRALIAQGEIDGDKGFSGRESIRLFGEFLSRHRESTGLGNMDNLTDFFKHRIDREKRNKNVPQNFLASLVNSYDYTVLGEVKEALYFYNHERIAKDVLNYLWATNYDIGAKVKCPETREEIEVTLDFLKLMASRFKGEATTDQGALDYAKTTQRKVAALVNRGERDISKTDLFRELVNTYTRNLKEKVLEPFAGNENFREAVGVFGTKEFDSFEIDRRLKEHIVYMMESLMKKFGYTEQGAKEIVLYVLKHDLDQKFA